MNTEPEITVLGAGGWIGDALVKYLRSQSRNVLAIFRHEMEDWLAGQDTAGTVIYCIGLTADFRHRPHSTVEAHVGVLSKVLQRPGVEKLLYLSSTRVYGRSLDTCESALLPCLTSDPSDLYNLSKLLGEALVLQDQRPGLKVVRLSNVVGPLQPKDTFIGALLEEAKHCNIVTIRQHADTTKNYVALSDVVRLLPLIAEHGQERLYNLGSCITTSHSDVALWLESQGINVRFANETWSNLSEALSFPPLLVNRLVAEFPPPTDPFGQTLL